MRNFFALYDEIRAELKKDDALVKLLECQLTETCYDDPELCTLTIDVGFYISRTYTAGKPDTAGVDEWWPKDYSPALSIEDWIALLGDEEVFTTSSLEIMKRMKDYGGQATCKQLAVKYGESVNFYISGSATLAKRVAEKTNCPIADALIAYLDQESTLLPSLKQQLRECEKSIQNMLNAIEAGIITPSTKQRLQDLEARREELNISILQEQLQKPRFTKEQIVA